jgi:hypothetical protein
MGEPRPRLAMAAALLLAVGCTTDSRDRRGDDPLLSSGSLRGQPLASASPTGGGPPPPAYQPKPPLTAATPTSNAALAGGGFQPLSGGTDLRMGSPDPNSGAAGLQLQQPGFTDPRTGAAPATPTGFSPVTPVPPPGQPVSATQPVPNAGPGGSLDAAFTAVAARNPLWTRLTYNGETREYLFQMKVPSRLNTAVAQTVDASAATPTEAIRRALEQLGN